MLKGDLALFSLGEIFQSLAINSHTGTLKIMARNQTEKQICFQKGEIVYLSDEAPSNRVPRIGEILVRMGIITTAQLEDALAEQRTSKEVLGDVLIRRRMSNPDDLRTAIETQTLEGIYDLFLLKEGTFEFHMNDIPEALTAGHPGIIPIALNTNSVIMEGLRQIDEWSLINKHIRTFHEIFKPIDFTTAGPEDQDGLLLDMVNGSRPVHELFKSYQGSRFACSKRLCEFIAKGYIRPLTEEECLALGADKREARQFSQAAAYLQFAVQLNPKHGPTYEQLGDALSSAYQDAAAKEAYLHAVRIHYEEEDFQGVAALGDKLLPRITFEDQDLERLFFSYVRLQNFKRAASTGNQLVAAHQKSGKFEEAAIVMEAIAAMDPSDLNLKIQAATLFEKAGNTLLATRELEEVAGTLEKDKKYRELIKILRLLSQLNPKRQELKQKISAVQALQEKIARRKKYGITIAGVSCITLLAFAVVPILYEVKAREYFGHAQRLEQTAMLSMDFGKAKDAYLEIVKNYCFSTKVAQAQEALERISQVERNIFNKMESEAVARKEEQESKIFSMREELAAKLREAEGTERAGDVERAHGMYKQITVDFSEIPATKNILFPLRITTEPSGAVVRVEGSELGKTPLLHHYKAGSTINLTITRSSCESIQQTVELSTQWELNYRMRRRPLTDFSLVPVILQPMTFCQQHLVVPSRDGNVYALDPFTKIVTWQRVVGRYGDRISNIDARGEEIYLCTVTGEVTAMSIAKGKSRWIARVGSSALAAPACSPDGRWVAVGTTSGTAFLIANDTGTITAKIPTENEILARPLFAGDFCIVGSTDNHVYGFSLSRQRLELDRELNGDVAFDLAGDGDAVLVVTSDGSVHRLDSRTLAVIWSRAIGHPLSTQAFASPGFVHVGTAAGRIITLDRRTGETVWESVAGKGSITGVAISEKRIYAGLDTGRIAAFELDSGKPAWEFQSDVPVTAPPILLEGLLYLGGVGGKIQYLEVLEP